MSEELKSRGDVEQELVKCESRLKELKAKAATEHEGELSEIEENLNACKLELGEVEHRTDDAWQEAKHGIVRRLSEVKRSLGLSARKMI